MSLPEQQGCSRASNLPQAPFLKDLYYGKCGPSIDFRSLGDKTESKQNGLAIGTIGCVPLTFHIRGKNVGLWVQITEFPKCTQLVSIHPTALADYQNTLSIMKCHKTEETHVQQLCPATRAGFLYPPAITCTQLHPTQQLCSVQTLEIYLFHLLSFFFSSEY